MILPPTAGIAVHRMIIEKNVSLEGARHYQRRLLFIGANAYLREAGKELAIGTARNQTSIILCPFHAVEARTSNFTLYGLTGGRRRI